MGKLIPFLFIALDGKSAVAHLRLRIPGHKLRGSWLLIQPYLRQILFSGYIMREQIKQDIDLIEILFYLKKKVRVILFIIAICMAMMLLFLYINKDNIKVSYSLKINQTTPGILVNCDSNNNFACQTAMTEDVIQRITTFFHTSPDVKNREIKLEWS